MVLSTSDARRPLVAAGALRAFARGGYHGTTIANVATEARISPAYVFKLFPSKERLFVAALDECFSRMLDTLRDGADASADQSATGILDAMGGAYAELISDRDLLMMQVHAQSVADVPEIRESLRAGLASVTRFAKTRSGADDVDVQRFIAYGQLCHLIVTTGLDSVSDEWASLLTAGIRHPD
jgi:AcrR family transcriptional regulator